MRSKTFVDREAHMNEREIFAQALQLPVAERAEFLHRACDGDVALHERLGRLLDEQKNLGSYLEVPAAGAVGIATIEPSLKQSGQRIGRYKLMEQLGEGGMGTVWVAEQTEPVRRRVALKLIKPGMDTRQVLSRFEAERQALALMDHPNIAKVFDGGMTDEGRPYFVMEYVKGVPITEFCDAARLSIGDRLKLFVSVCQAVQHAHQKGVIHRDLKPSNILVCLFDGQPVPKVIDFGLAKAISQPLTEHTLYTAHGLMVGTPLYMSPEQAEFNNLDVDTRADVYSLGVILYELLTGTTPLETRQFKDAAFQEILRLIKEVEPAKPSDKLSTSASLPSIAAQRNLEPAQLSRLVRGDLDWIVMKALEKERNRRYETANGLARDIERYFHDEPVEAGPPSVGYRIGKFVRRNKVALATTTLVLVASILGGGVSLWMSFEAEKARALAAEREKMQKHSLGLVESNRQIAVTTTIRRRKLDDSASIHLNQIAAHLGQDLRLREPALEPLRQQLLQRVLDYWDDAVSVDLSVTGKLQGRAEYYRLQRILCLARGGNHAQASTEAAELWNSATRLATESSRWQSPSREVPVAAAQNGHLSDLTNDRTRDLAYEIARVYAICVSVATDHEALAGQYADRAMQLLKQADQALFFAEPDNAKRLVGDADLAALEPSESFREFRKQVFDREK
jgi:serine/threonine protein kinase